MKKTFATAVNCIDGRVQRALIDFMMKEYGVDYIDVVTEPGPDKILSENKDPGTVGSIKDRVSISVEKHGSNIIVIAGHHDCAANPVPEDEHRTQIREAARHIRQWKLEADVYGAWINEKWEISLL